MDPSPCTPMRGTSSLSHVDEMCSSGSLAQDTRPKTDQTPSVDMTIAAGRFRRRVNATGSIAALIAQSEFSIGETLMAKGLDI